MNRIFRINPAALRFQLFAFDFCPTINPQLRNACLGRLSWKQLAAVDKPLTMIPPLRNPSPVGQERVTPQCGSGEGMIWQRVADFEAFRQVAEQGGAFFGQNAGQPMAHEH
jgi:hypothetical protein